MMPSHVVVSLARKVLFSFLSTFIAARILVFLIMSHRIPDLYLHLGGTHVHHMNYGIFLLAGVGAYLLLAGPVAHRLSAAAVVYGIGLALTFDEFGMWLHLGGSYWQRASWDAIVVLSGSFGLLAFAPSIKQFRPRQWWSAFILVISLSVFFFLLHESLGYSQRTIAPKLLEIESHSPR